MAQKQLRLTQEQQPQVDKLVDKWAARARSLYDEEVETNDLQRVERAYQDLFRLLKFAPFKAMVRVGSPPVVSIGGAFAAWVVFKHDTEPLARKALNDNIDSLAPELTRSVEAGLSLDYLLGEVRRVVETVLATPNLKFGPNEEKNRPGQLRDYIQQVRYHRLPGSMWTTVPLIKDLEDLARGEESYEEYGMETGREADIRQCLDAVSESGWTFTTTEFCVNCPRPTRIVLDNRHRFSNTEGPALEYADGYKAYFIRDIQVPRRWIEDKSSLGLNDYLSESNQEKQAVLLELVGWDRLVDEIDHTIVDNDVDRYGRDRSLLRCKVPGFDEDVAIVRVWNSTIEPDGTRKRYGLRVDPRMRTCHEAVASTFGVLPEEYKPLVET